MKKYLIGHGSVYEPFKGIKQRFLYNPTLVNFSNGSFGIRTGRWFEKYRFLSKNVTTTYTKKRDVGLYCTYDLTEAKQALLKLKKLDKNNKKHLISIKKRYYLDREEELDSSSTNIKYQVVGVVKDD